MMIEKDIAKSLLDVKAVFLKPNEPFTWASGIKSPIYCDNRLVLSYPDKRDQVKFGLVELIKKKYPEVEVIMGTATAGIPMASLIADVMALPMGYVRSSNKSHGKENKIEGRILPSQKVVVVEDLISTGGSCITAVESLREAGAEVLGVVAIFSYLLPAASKAFGDINCDFATLSNYDALLEAAVENNYVQASDLEKLNAWKKDPKDESWMNK